MRSIGSSVHAIKRKQVCICQRPVPFPGAKSNTFQLPPGFRNTMPVPQTGSAVHRAQPIQNSLKVFEPTVISGEPLFYMACRLAKTIRVNVYQPIFLNVSCDPLICLATAVAGQADARVYSPSLAQRHAL
jgi:hypothetical protein